MTADALSPERRAASAWEHVQIVKTWKWRAAIRHPEGPESSTVRHVLLTLSIWADRDGSHMYPSQEMLAQATALNRETVRRALDAAATSGWVVRCARQELTGDPIRDAQLFGYQYFAAVPRGWPHLDRIDMWQVDPQYTSERRRRPRTRQGRVPAQSGDVGTPEAEHIPAPVPVVSRKVPTHDSHVPVLGGGVPTLNGGRPLPGQPDLAHGSPHGSSSSTYQDLSQARAREETLERKPKAKTARPERPSKARPDLYNRKWLLQNLEIGMDAERIAVMTGQPIETVRREIRQARDPEAPLTDRTNVHPTEATP